MLERRKIRRVEKLRRLVLIQHPAGRVELDEIAAHRAPHKCFAFKSVVKRQAARNQCDGDAANSERTCLFFAGQGADESLKPHTHASRAR